VITPLSLPVKQMHEPEDHSSTDPSAPASVSRSASVQHATPVSQAFAPRTVSAELTELAVHQLSPSSQVLDQPKPGLVRELVQTPEGDFWSEVVFQLVESGKVHGLNRELALQSQLIGRESDGWILRVESENLNSSSNREKLQNALHAAGYPVKLQFEIGVVRDSPARRNIANNLAKEKRNLETIQNDPFVIKMMAQFDAKIIMGSIKPITPNESKSPTISH
jgi:DNA polymerase-3 subunit gamma/tau